MAGTIGNCFRNRVTGLAAEAAFFALLSLPPLIFGLAGSVGAIFERFSASEINDFKDSVIRISERAFTPATVDKIIRPTLDDVLSGPRLDVVSIGFVLALWSGSRALHVIIDTIAIMYGKGGTRGIVRSRMLSFSLYVLALLTGVVTMPLVVAGPNAVEQLLPDRLDWLVILYWPVVLVVGVCFLTTLYAVAVPARIGWTRNLPGAALTMLLWLVGSAVLRWFLVATSGESTSIYGPLAAPIAVMLWLYVVSMAVLIGAALNAAWDVQYPRLGAHSG